MQTIRIDHNGNLLIPWEFISGMGLMADDPVDLVMENNRLIISKAAAPVSNDLCFAISRKNLATSIRFIKGIGPKMAELLARRGINTVEDALFCLPHRYEDRRSIIPVSQLKIGDTQLFQGTVVSVETVVTKGGKKFFEALVQDQEAAIVLKWFRANTVWMSRVWKAGKKGVFIGEVTSFGNRLEVHHPDVHWLEDDQDAASVMAADQLDFGRIVPVYPLTEGLHQKGMRRIIAQVVENFISDVQNILPPTILAGYNYLPLQDALHLLHLPPSDTPLEELNLGSTRPHRSVAFDEFFFWELGLLLKKQGVTIEDGIAFKVTHRYTKELARLLPFQLTAAQRRVLSEIKQDMMAPHPMHRLVQGDVGCGKTMVALMAALLAVENGYQVAIMAPTEILAEQHWHNIHGWCEQLVIKVVLLTAGLKGKEKKLAMQQIADGTASIVIGTHAVIQEKVEFHRLGLGVVDEQHRFGVLQRGIMKKKGTNPDILVMTATPIPRTLSMTLFGDLSLSVIDELPPGRTPVITRLFFESRRSQMYQLLQEQILSGYQAYIIYPLVEESENSDLKAATQMAEHLQADIFPKFRLGLLHGRMKPSEKESVMQAFKGRKLDILVATTVIEVGIDVPDATIMVIEHAERFGLSQLHQLRGRVGRGSNRSQCILMTEGRLSEDAEKRLKVMESTTDGFRIAEADLEIRGPGDFLGTRQSGMPDFRVANILRDAAILEAARNAATKQLEDDPLLASDQGKRIREELVRRWGTRLELAAIA